MKYGLYITFIILISSNLLLAQKREIKRPTFIQNNITQDNPISTNQLDFDILSGMPLLIGKREDQVVNQDEWLFKDSTAYYFDSNENLLLEKRLRYNVAANNWSVRQRIIHEYDSDNNETSILSQHWEDGWRSIYQSKYSYNSNGDLLISVFQQSNGEELINLTKVIFGYDNHNNRILIITQNWKVDRWNNEDKKTKEFDHNNNLVRNVHQKWISNSWKNQRLTLMEYDVLNNTKLNTTQIWKDSIWENKSKSDYSYLNNNKTKQITSVWSNELWKSKKQVIYEYDTHNNQISLLAMIYSQQEWVNIWKETNTYNTDHNLILSQKEAFQSNKWINKSQTLHTYNENKELIKSLEQKWNENKWKNNKLIIREFNAIMELISNQTKQWGDSQWTSGVKYNHFYHENGLPSHSIKQNLEIFEWVNSKRTTYYFNNVTGIKTTDNFEFSIYPNPVNNEIHIQTKENDKPIESIKIFNLNGKLIKEVKHPMHNNNYTIESTKIPSGIYIIQLVTQNKIRSQKVKIFHH